MRITDATMSFPVILLALILAVTVGPSFVNVVIAIAVILWARYARVIRGQVLTLMELDFHHAGAHRRRLGRADHPPAPLSQHPQHADGPGHAPGRLRHHRGGLALVPGRGHSAADARVGLDDRRGARLRDERLVGIVLSRLAILLVVLAFNLLGDWLRDTLDPKLRQL